MPNHDEQSISSEESFHNSFNSFIADLNALSQPPYTTCEMFGFYNVAYEFWYLFVDESLLALAKDHLSETQLSAMGCMFHDIKCLPKDAYEWTNVSEDSVKHMSHSAWSPIRQQAKDLMLLLATAIKRNQEYLSV